MRILAVCAAVTLGAAFVLGASNAAQAQTTLNLSANGTNTVDPDEVIASLDIQASSASAANAQASVNRQMKHALDAVKAVPGVIATTGNYSVYQNMPDNQAKSATYQASQGLQLTMMAPGGVPPDAFTALAGQLQQNGLLLNTLDGDLSSKGRELAQQAAVTDAIRQIQAQAAAVAATLGEHVGKIKSLTVDVNTPGPIIRAAPMAMMAAASPPPQAAPGKVTVQANVSATIDLTALP
jgi:uncharacterized protein